MKNAFAFTLVALGLAAINSAGSKLELLSNAELSRIAGSDFCYGNTRTPCDLPLDSPECAKGLQFCINNVCPVPSGLEIAMEDYNEAKSREAGVTAKVQGYEPLFCVIGRPCTCYCYHTNTGEICVCGRSDDFPNFYGSIVYESWATGDPCPLTMP
jgi:hypothetical protein